MCMRTIKLKTSELTFHIMFCIHRSSVSVQDLNMGYLPHFRNFLTKPLMTGDSDNVSDVVQLLNDYDLTREDFDSILEVSQYQGNIEPMSAVPTKVRNKYISQGVWGTSSIALRY